MFEFIECKMGISDIELIKIQNYLAEYNDRLIQRIPQRLPETMINIANNQMQRVNNMIFEKVC